MTGTAHPSEDQVELLRGVVDATHLLVVVTDRTGAVQLLNQAVKSAIGPTGRLTQRPLWDLAAFPSEAEALRRWFEPFDGDALPSEVTFHLTRSESAPALVEWDIRLVNDGPDTWVVFAGVDVSDRVSSRRDDQMVEDERAARMDVEMANARLQLLVEGNRRLSPRLNPNDILQSLAQLVIPALADWSMIVHHGWQDGALFIASAHGDPNKEMLLADLPPWRPEAGDESPGRVFRTGEVAVYSDIGPERLSRDPRQIERLRELGVRSVLSVPIMGRSGVDAVMTLVSSHDPHRYAREEILLAEDLAARAAVSLENGRLLFEALDAVRARDDFLAVAAHELRTPLTSLLLQTQLLRRAVGSDRADLSAANRSADAVDSQARRLSNLVDGLLDVTRLGANRLGLRRETVDVRELLEGVVATMAPDFRRASSRVSVTAPARVTAQWDRRRIEQVLTNVLGNAIKFGAGGAIELDAELRGSVVEISIRDHGIGISQEDQPRIFGRFERAVPTHHFGGLGLGLYISAQILRAHSGTIRVESTPGQGARFVITLPRGLEDMAMASDASFGP